MEWTLEPLARSSADCFGLGCLLFECWYAIKTRPHVSLFFENAKTYNSVYKNDASTLIFSQQIFLTEHFFIVI